MIVLNILADVLYDLLRPDKSNVPPRSNCDITYMYQEHRKLNKHIPTNRWGWGGSWQDILSTDIAIGDDIERIRLTRNELQHSKAFKLDENRFDELCIIILDILKRFDQHNKPSKLYTDHMNEVLTSKVSAEEVKVVQHQIEKEIKSGTQISHFMTLDLNYQISTYLKNFYNFQFFNIISGFIHKHF